MAYHRFHAIMKSILRIISILLLIGLLGGIGYFVVYPNLSRIRLTLDSLDPRKTAHNLTLQLFLKISPPNFQSDDPLSQALAAVDYISPEQLASVSNQGDVTTNLEEKNSTLTVKSADIKGRLQEGPDAFAMMDGPWHFPISVAPGERGNSVIIGHRFAEVPPSTNTFFNLDKIRVGDKIKIAQDDGDFTFTVVETKIVEKNDRSVILPTTDHRITLITCSPLWTSDQRLVIVGILDKIYKNI